jgi:hypothetical protein
MHGFLSSKRRRRRNQSSRRQFRCGRRRAVLRALTGARLYLEGYPSFAFAAESCGSNAVYVKAAVVLLRSENTKLRSQALTGRVSLLAAANQVRRVSKLVAAYRDASPLDRVAAVRAIGPEAFFDGALAPAIGTDDTFEPLDEEVAA